MRNTTTPKTTRRGFTILELLIVVSIIAIIATLAIGAAIKSVKQARNRRVDTMARGLEIALANYRAQENTWPFSIDDFVQDQNDRSRYWIHGKNNAKAFKKLYDGSGGQKKSAYLEASSYLVLSGGSRVSLRVAIDKGRTDAVFGYPLPDNTSRFCCYCLCYNPLTDTVKVVRQDTKHFNVNGGQFKCPEWTP